MLQPSASREGSKVTTWEKIFSIARCAMSSARFPSPETAETNRTSDGHSVR